MVASGLLIARFGMWVFNFFESDDVTGAATHLGNPRFSNGRKAACLPPRGRLILEKLPNPLFNPSPL